ncbi:hypothetical protein EDF54_3284 [Rathayibacter sp. PhB93]|uniref:hypothetical protein n=1 Tax=unclassified Rathayibacter TaxID=2609250 RepID=UPI000F4A662C|nr:MULTISPECIES: hypothetical protein [unclassified Rathayibacter]ROQ03805.1 hypothetical protein EDF54_3284 [Rathayibacter sp. PhB93]TDQ10830.1 hypothetical protein EDF17_3072 [Rathayibacter sp. PhB1]
MTDSTATDGTGTDGAAHDDTAHDDTALSQRLTAAIRETAGVTGVYPAQPLLEAAADALAVKLALRQPDVLVDIDRSDGFTTVTAHIAATAALPAPETLRAVGEELRRLLDAEPSVTGPLAVNVKVRLIEDSGRAAD